MILVWSFAPTKTVSNLKNLEISRENRCNLSSFNCPVSQLKNDQSDYQRFFKLIAGWNSSVNFSSVEFTLFLNFSNTRTEFFLQSFVPQKFFPGQKLWANWDFRLHVFNQNNCPWCKNSGWRLVSTLQFKKILISRFNALSRYLPIKMWLLFKATFSLTVAFEKPPSPSTTLKFQTKNVKRMQLREKMKMKTCAEKEWNWV